MTTPAINISATKKVQGSSQPFNPSNPNGGAFVYEQVSIGRLHRKRGMSVSSPMTLGHFRFPTYWRHEGGFLPMGFDCLYDYGEIYNTKPYFTRYYFVGSDFWISLGALMEYPLDLESKCINGLLKSIKDQKVNLAQAFAERQQTVDLVTDICDRLYVAVKKFKAVKGRKWWKRFIELMKKETSTRREPGKSRYVINLTASSPRRARQRKRKKVPLVPTDESITSDWLAFQYGLKPLMQDAYGSMQELNDKELGDPQFYRGYQKSKKGMMVNAEHLDAARLNVPYASGVRLIYRTSTFHGCSAEVNFDIVNDLIANLSSLGVTNPALLLYELTPLSFMLDWTINLSDYLGLMDATAGWQFLSGSVSKVSKMEGMIVGAKNVAKLPAVPNLFVDIHSLGRAPAREFWFERQKMSNFPGPRMPPFKNPITLGHYANFCALMVQLFR